LRASLVIARSGATKQSPHRAGLLRFARDDRGVGRINPQLSCFKHDRSVERRTQPPPPAHGMQTCRHQSPPPPQGMGVHAAMAMTRIRTDKIFMDGSCQPRPTVATLAPYASFPLASSNRSMMGSSDDLFTHVRARLLQVDSAEPGHAGGRLARQMSGPRGIQ